jgi:hypothetical protein
MSYIDYRKQNSLSPHRMSKTDTVHSPNGNTESKATVSEKVKRHTCGKTLKTSAISVSAKRHHL